MEEGSGAPCSADTPGKEHPSGGSAQQWVTYYDGPGDAENSENNDEATSLAVSPDGTSLYVAGRSMGPTHGGTSDEDFATVAYSTATGEERWVSRYDGPDPYGGEVAREVDVAPDGCRIFVTGFDYDSTGSSFDGDYVTVAYSAAAGEELWAARYAGPANALDRSYLLAMSPDGTKVFVSGESNDKPWSGGDEDPIAEEPRYLTVAYSSTTGERLWTARYRGPGSGDVPSAMALSPDGSQILVTGYSESSEGFIGFGTVAYSTDTGEQQWENRFGGSPRSAEYPAAVEFTDTGSSVIVTGSSHHGDSSAVTVAYDADTGEQRWVVQDPRFQAQVLAVASEGPLFYVSGYGWDGEVRYFLTAALSEASGEEVWTSRYVEPPNAAERRPFSAISAGVTPDGSRVYVTGSSVRTNVYDIRTENWATIGYEASSGEQLWVGRFNGPRGGQDQPAALEISPDGQQVFVAGFSRSSESYNWLGDFATISYDAAATGVTEDGPPDPPPPPGETCGDFESGPVSGPVHHTVEPYAGPARSTIHAANCQLAARGL